LYLHGAWGGISKRHRGSGANIFWLESGKQKATARDCGDYRKGEYGGRLGEKVLADSNKVRARKTAIV